MRSFRELNDDEFDRLTADLLDRVAVHVPEWTNWRERDPGVTLVELIAFLTESLLARQHPSRGAVGRVGDLPDGLEEAVDSFECREIEIPMRVRYFFGQVLSAADFEHEQRYHRDRHRRHNLLVHGIGIVRGLDVRVEPADPGDQPVVAVSPGVAIAPDGEELVVCDPVTHALPADASSFWVALALVDRVTRIVPGLEGEEAQATRIEEVVQLVVVPEIGEGQLAIARVERVDGGWRNDPAFRPLRAGR